MLSITLLLSSTVNCQNSKENESFVISEKQQELVFETAKGLPNGAQLSIAIIKNGHIAFYGIKREMDSSVVVDNRTAVFETGSITKAFTATLLSDFVLNEQLSINHNISDYLGFPLNNNVKITFEQLATHTSGLPRIPEVLDLPTVDLKNPYKDYGEGNLKQYLTKELKLANEPGEKCEYSNLGFGILGYTLSIVGRATYEELLQTHIFSKYGMKSSTTLRNQIKDDLILGIDDNGEVVPNWDMSAHMGAGGVLSSTEDLTKFAMAHFDNSNESLNLTRTPFFKLTDDYSIGLAWGLLKSESGHIWNWHNGGTGGYTSSMIFDTKTKNGVIILSNISALGKLTNTISGLSPELMKSLE